MKVTKYDIFTKSSNSGRNILLSLWMHQTFILEDDNDDHLYIVLKDTSFLYFLGAGMFRPAIPKPDVIFGVPVGGDYKDKEKFVFVKVEKEQFFLDQLSGVDMQKEYFNNVEYEKKSKVLELSKYHSRFFNGFHMLTPEEVEQNKEEAIKREKYVKDREQDFLKYNARNAMMEKMLLGNWDSEDSDGEDDE